MKDYYLQRLLKENVELHNKITAYHAVLCDHNLLDEAEKQAKEFEKMLNSECPCEDGIDSKACAGCPQDEARIVNEAWHNAIWAENESVNPSLIERVKKLRNQQKTPQKKERPFKDCDELVEFWTKRYQTVMRPAHTKPLIWVRLKCDGRERLVVAFGKGLGTDFVEIGNKAKAVTLKKLFEDYEFLDGCVIGVKEGAC